MLSEDLIFHKAIRMTVILKLATRLIRISNFNLTIKFKCFIFFLQDFIHIWLFFMNYLFWVSGLSQDLKSFPNLI